MQHVDSVCTSLAVTDECDDSWSQRISMMYSDDWCELRRFVRYKKDTASFLTFVRSGCCDRVLPAVLACGRSDCALPADVGRAGPALTLCCACASLGLLTNVDRLLTRAIAGLHPPYRRGVVGLDTGLPGRHGRTRGHWRPGAPWRPACCC